MMNRFTDHRSPNTEVAMARTKRLRVVRVAIASIKGKEGEGVANY